MYRNWIFVLFIVVGLFGCSSSQTEWNIGIKDASPEEFALAPDGFEHFLEKDFGFEDNYFIVGYSKEKTDFPYVLAGPVDTWGGTWNTAGWRTNEINILFNTQRVDPNATYKFRVALVDYAKKFLPLVKIEVNENSQKYQLHAKGYYWKDQLNPSLTEAYVDSTALKGDLSKATPTTLEMNIPASTLRKGGNHIKISILQGSWIMFDHIQLQGPSLEIIKPRSLFVKEVKPASYELVEEGRSYQPLLVNVEHLKGAPLLKVLLDGKQIFSQKVEKGHYLFEALMPSVTEKTTSRYEVVVDDQIVAAGKVIRNAQKRQTYADYIDTRIGTGHSRWMIAPGPWMPFGMVKISPDNQNSGWQAGYQPSIENIGTFSHIHEWTMAGLGLFATNGPLKTYIGHELDPDSGYRSRIDKSSEIADIGYYKVHLNDYDIQAELTATTRCSFSRFTFPQDRDSARVLLDFHIPSEYDYRLKEVYLKQVGSHRIEGFSHQYAATVWSNDASQDYTVHFVMDFDQPIQSLGYWKENKVEHASILKGKDLKEAGAFIQFDVKNKPTVQVRTGISFVSVENARLNLQKEIIDPFNWSFDAVCQNQKKVWNDLFNRVKITSSDFTEKRRFYNAMYRSVCSRNIFSDVNGQWKGTDLKVNMLDDKNDVALGCDAFWNTFWNLNQFWNLVTPEWSSRWVKSQLAMYDAYGWLAKGPAGMNYIPVMVAEHEIPMMVGAYQMGIRDFDASKVLKAAVKMQTTPSQKFYNGYVGNRDLETYLKHGYVPYDKGRFSNSLEYSFDDWTVGQLAKSLGDNKTYQQFNKRGYWWKNVISNNGYAQLKDSQGEWSNHFDPFTSGANHHYVEGNAWQLTFFVPQDIPELVSIIGKKAFVDRLKWGFKQSDIWRYNGMNDQYWDYPVVQGNQQSMHFAYLFNWAGKPWLTQKWSRSIIDRYYGSGINNAYLGDEDQGQMSAWFVMSAIGLFQTDGGTRMNPIYELTSPIYQKIEIDLGGRYGRGNHFTIIANHSSRTNKYIQSATLNGKKLNSFKFSAKELLKGGNLILEMGDKPNKQWGISEN